MTDPKVTSPLTESEVRLLKAIRRVERADVEFTRARQSCEQPRLSKAGTSYWLAHTALYKLAKEINRV